MIVAGDLKPGDRVVESRMARQIKSARQVAQRKFRQFAKQHLGSYGSEGSE